MLFHGFLVDFEQSRKHDLEMRMDRLGASLGQAVDVTVEQVRRRVGRMASELKGLQRRLEQFSRNVAAKLLPLLPDGDADAVFRLINPEVLGLVVGEEGLAIRDEQQLAAVLAQFIGRIREGIYEDDLVRVLLGALSTPDLAAYRDAVTLDLRIVELEEALKREQRILEAAENSEQIRREKNQLQQEWRRISDHLNRYQVYQERLPAIRQRIKEKGESGSHAAFFQQ